MDKAIGRGLYVGFILIIPLLLWQGQLGAHVVQQSFLFPISSIEYRDVERTADAVLFTPIFKKTRDGKLLSVQAYYRVGAQRVYLPIRRSDDRVVGTAKRAEGEFIPEGIPWEIRIPPAFTKDPADFGIVLFYDGMFGAIGRDFPCGCPP